MTRSGCTGRPLLVSYASSGTAKPGRDYRKLHGNVLLRTGRASATIVVQPQDDFTPEPEERVTISLSTSAEYILGSSTSADVVISDNDAGP